MIAKTKTKTEYEFGPCPSPHGWHNPHDQSANEIMEVVMDQYGDTVNVKHARLLTRDEIGSREEESPDIKNHYTACIYSSISVCDGDEPDQTYFTLTAYGYLQPVTRYTFPECAPYGWSRKTGEKIPVPDGYELVPEGEVVKCSEILIHYLDGIEVPCNAVFPDGWKRSTRDAVFRKLPSKNPDEIKPLSMQDIADRLDGIAKYAAKGWHIVAHEYENALCKAFFQHVKAFPNDPLLEQKAGLVLASVKLKFPLGYE